MACGGEPGGPDASTDARAPDDGGGEPLTVTYELTFHDAVTGEPIDGVAVAITF